MGTIPIFARDFKYTYEGQTLTYTVINEAQKTVETKAGSYTEGKYGQVSFTHGNEISGREYWYLKIPPTVKDGDIEYTVTKIGVCSFVGQKTLATIEIPNTIHIIDEYAFALCDHLRFVVIPNSVRKISYCAFYNCDDMQYAIVGNSVVLIEEDAFKGCVNLVKSAYPDNLQNPFSNNGGLRYRSSRLSRSPAARLRARGISPCGDPC